MAPVQNMNRLPGAIYARISSDPRKKELGVKRQVTLSRDYADRRGVAIPEDRIFVDNDLSAMDPKVRREAYEQLLKLVRADEVRVIVVYQNTRLWRSREERNRLFELLTAHKVDVWCVRDTDLDFSSAGGRLVADVVAATNVWESEVKRERQLDEHWQRATRGVPPGGHRLYGYTQDGMHLVTEEAAVVAEVFGQFNAGETITGLVRQLNARGLLTSKGRPFNRQAVRAILTNERYAGLRELHGETYPGGWPVIVSESQLKAAREVVQDPSRRTSQGHEVTRLGSGLYRCGACELAGAVTTLKTMRRHGKRGYRCREYGHLSRIGEPVDLLVEGVVIARLARADAVDLLADDDRPDAELLRAEAVALRERQRSIAAMLGRGVMSEHQFEVANAEVQGLLERVQSQMQDVQRAPVLGDLIAAEDVARAWQGMSLGRQRAVVDCLMTVTVLPTGAGRGSKAFNPESVRIDWR